MNNKRVQVNNININSRTLSLTMAITEKRHRDHILIPVAVKFMNLNNSFQDQ